MKRAVQFGAGNIGRGFMGQLLCESGFEITFVEADKQLVTLLNDRGNYPLQLLDAIAQVTLPEKISENIYKRLYPFGSREKDYNRICFLML